MDPGYQLSFRQLQLCLSDCRGLKSITWVHFSGGEPTLWTEANRDLGAYGRFHQKREGEQPEPSGTRERERASCLALIGDDYYFHIPNKDSEFPDQWRKVARLGHLPGEIAQAHSCSDGA